MCNRSSHYLLQLITIAFFGLKAAAAKDSTTDRPVPRVVNGIPAFAGEIPYQVALKVPARENDIYYTKCGAAIIGRSKILSAAHCFFKKHEEKNKCQEWFGAVQSSLLKLSSMYAVAGTVRNRGLYKRDGESTEQWRQIKLTLIPTGYDFPTRDIAVAFTCDPFVFNEYVSPLPFAKRDRDYGSIQCTVSGYGKISYNIHSDSLLWAKLRLIPSAWCSQIHHQNMKDFICTESLYTDVLEGDSGGPLVCDDADSEGGKAIVGVVSGMREFSGTFFTRVSSYAQFVDQNGSTRIELTVTLFCFVLCIKVLLFSFLFDLGWIVQYPDRIISLLNLSISHES